jgi:hypothetical protein
LLYSITYNFFFPLALPLGPQHLLRLPLLFLELLPPSLFLRESGLCDLVFFTQLTRADKET